MSDFAVYITEFLWRQSLQIIGLFVIVGGLCWLARNKDAHLRYALWFLVLAKCLIPPVNSVPITAPSVENHGFVFSAATDTISHVTQSYPNMKVYLGYAWLLGVCLFLGYSLTKAMKIRLWLVRAEERPDLRMTREFMELKNKLGLKGGPKLLVMDQIEQPFVWGWIRGNIYAPEHFGRLGSKADRRNILMHEISHVLRRDAGLNCLQIVIQSLFFFHPLVWITNHHIRCEREKCCDEAVVARMDITPETYSSAIIDHLMHEVKGRQTMGAGGSLKGLEERIKALMKPGRRFHYKAKTSALAFVLFLAFVFLSTTPAFSDRDRSPVLLKESRSNPISQPETPPPNLTTPAHSFIQGSFFSGLPSGSLGSNRIPKESIEDYSKRVMGEKLSPSFDIGKLKY